MRLSEIIGRWLPTSRGTLEAVEAHAAAERGELKQEVARLEGLLDAVGDPDENLAGNQAQGLFRQVLGDEASGENRDFAPTMRARILRLAHQAYALRGPAENLIESHMDFLLGDELKIVADNDELQGLLDEIWKDPRNHLDTDHEDLARSLIHEGELILRSDLSPVDGHLELGWTDPLVVSGVTQDRRRRDSFLAVAGKNPGEVLIWFVLNNLNDQITVAPWPDDMPNKEAFKYLVREESVGNTGVSIVTAQRGVHDLCLYFPWNRPKGARRGRGELTSSLDAIDAQDELIWSTVDVQNVKRMFLLHLKDDSIRSKSQGREALKQYGLLSPPRNPKSVATNKSVEIEIKQHQAADSEKWLADELGVQIMGAKGMPGSWRGSQGQSRFAGQRGAGDMVPLRRLRRKQRRLLRVFRTLVDTQLELFRRAGREVPEGSYKLVTLEVGGKDKQRGAEVLKAVAAAAVQMGSVDGAKPELLNKLFVQAVREELGYEVQPKLEGLPEDLLKRVADVSDQVAQILSQRSRRDDEGNQDEDDRDRAEERVQ